MTRRCECGLILVNPVSLADGRCMDCRGDGIQGWYTQELARRLVEEAERRAEAHARLLRRVYGKAGKPVEAESAAEVRGRAVGRS
jgi:hypothetical protein